MMIKALVKLVKEGREQKDMILLFFLYISIAISNIFIAEAVGATVQYAMTEEMKLVFSGVLLFMTAKISSIFLEYASGILSCNIKEKLIVRYRLLSMISILDAEYGWIKKQKAGDILGRMQEDVSISAEAVAIYVPDILRRVLIISSIIIVIFYNDWRLGVTFLLPIPFMIILQFLGSNICDRYMNDSRKAESRRDAQIQDILNNRRTAKVFQAEEEVIGWAHNRIEQYIRKFTKAMIMIPVSFSPAGNDKAKRDKRNHKK